MGIALWPAPLRAQVRRPELNRPTAPGDLAFRLSLGLDNDNLLLGLWRLIGDDGDDTGRTHASDLRFAATRADGITFGLQVESALYLTDNDRPRRVADEDGNWLYRDDDGVQGFLVRDVFIASDGRVVPQSELQKIGPRIYVDGRGMLTRLDRQTFVFDGEEVDDIDVNTATRVKQRTDLPVDFRELTYLRVSADSRAQDRAVYWRVHSGVVIRNGQNVTGGATGQQVVWHRLIDWRQYRYRPAQEPNRFGILFGGVGGLDGLLGTLSPRARLYGRLEGGAELSSLVPANRATGTVQMVLEGGPLSAPWGELRLTQDLDFYLASLELLTTSRIQGAVHFGPGSFYLRLNLYAGGLVNDLFVFNRNRPTTEAGLEVRF